MKKRVERIEKTLIDSLYLDSCVTVNACESVRIENCKRVIECNEVLVRIKTTDCEVSIWGKDLVMECYKDSNIRVFGEIKSVEFEANRK